MTATKFRPAAGDQVLLSTPDNPRADGQPATVAAVAEWGCHLTTAFGSGAFRAAWSELLPADRPPAVRNAPARPMPVKTAGYSGEICPKCQGQRLVRAGTCQTCLDCGETTGCS